MSFAKNLKAKVNNIAAKVQGKEEKVDLSYAVNPQVFAAESQIDPHPPSGFKEKDKTMQANNQLLLSMNVTKLKLREWGFNATIEASIKLAFLELRMSFTRKSVEVKVEELEMETDHLEKQLDAVNIEEEAGGAPDSPSSSPSTPSDSDYGQEGKGGLGNILKDKLLEGLDKMLHGIKVSARKMKKAGWEGSIGAAITIGLFGFEISIGVEIEMSEMETVLMDEDDTKPGCGFLTLNLIDGKSIPALDKNKNGTADPYVSFKSGYIHSKSKVQKKTVAPVWNEMIRLESNINEKLRVRIYDQNNLYSNKKLGEKSFSVRDLGMADGKPRDFILPCDGGGEVRFRAVFKFYKTDTNIKLVKKMLGDKNYIAPPELALPPPSPVMGTQSNQQPQTPPQTPPQTHK